MAIMEPGAKVSFSATRNSWIFPSVMLAKTGRYPS